MTDRMMPGYGVQSFARDPRNINLDYLTNNGRTRGSRDLRAKLGGATNINSYATTDAPEPVYGTGEIIDDQPVLPSDVSESFRRSRYRERFDGGECPCAIKNTTRATEDLASQVAANVSNVSSEDVKIDNINNMLQAQIDNNTLLGSQIAKNEARNDVITNNMVGVSERIEPIKVSTVGINNVTDEQFGISVSQPAGSNPFGIGVNNTPSPWSLIKSSGPAISVSKNTMPSPWSLIKSGFKAPNKEGFIFDDMKKKFNKAFTPAQRTVICVLFLAILIYFVYNYLCETGVISSGICNKTKATSPSNTLNTSAKPYKFVADTDDLFGN